jgi:hypothetical protein
MKNIHILPTDKPSRLFVDIDDNKLKITQPLSGEYMMNQNIYITSDEEIKDVRPHKGKWQLEKGQILNKFPNYLTDLSDCKLVIMTTDQDLIKDGVQAIDDEFLEWFVKNPSCEEVDVKNPLITNISDFGYKIIIPKEEAKQTAVEWLINQLGKSGFDFSFHQVEIEQAKKMEEQQIVDAYKDSTSQFSVDARIDYPKSAEQYYNEQFKNK